MKSQPVTAEWAAASRSSGFTTCCSELTGRYWIWPSWLTAIWTNKEHGAISFRQKKKKRLVGEHFRLSANCKSVVDYQYPSHLLLLQKGCIMLILDDLSVWHLRNRGAVRERHDHLKTLHLFISEGEFSWGKTLTCMWLPSATTTYSWGIKCCTPSCEMIYWTWNRRQISSDQRIIQALS